jgi:antitoxin VapB
MPTTRVFRSGNSLAVRLPKEFAFEEGSEVEIRRQGASIVLTPVRLDMGFLVERLRQPLSALSELRRPDFRSPRRDWPGARDRRG